MNTETEYPKEKALGKLISETAFSFPERIAVKFGQTQLSYKALNEQVNQLAAYLIDQDIRVGNTVGLCIDRSPEMIIGLLAIMKAGAAYIPLDPNFPADRLTFMLDDSGASLLITTPQYASLFDADTRKIFIAEALANAKQYSTTEPEVTIGGDDLAYVLYTSGSTGLPKGVQIEHHNLVNFLTSMQSQPGLTADDILLSVTTISFDIAGLELFLPLITGATLIIADTESAKDGRILLEMVQKEKVTVMQATPYTWRMMLAAGWDTPLPLKVLCGGEALPKKLAINLVPVCAELWNMYGPTETTIWSTIKKITSTDEITIGYPINNTQVYIVDDILQQVPPGVIGEICIGGDGVARGYLNRPELTANRFVEDHFSGKPGSKIYRTGDLGRLGPSGEIICLGRIDHQIKIRGYRIETQEIEHNLTKQHNVSEAVVVVHTDDLENQRLIAYVKLKDDSLSMDLRQYSMAWADGLKDKLPEYMMPNDYFLIDELPLTPNGKIDRKALPQPVFNTLTINTGEYVAPATETEKILVDLWSKYLGLKKIGASDNFFDLGGHSMVAVRIMVDIEKLTGQRVPIAILFEHPTIQQLSRWLDNTDKKTTWKSLVRIKAGGNKTPLYIIHGEGLNVLIFKGLGNYLDAEQPVYGLQSIGLDGVEEQFDTMEKIAAHYNAEILEQNPAGPYAILGYSLGGHIAIEMASQLKKQGKDVRLLGMIDTNLKPSDGDTGMQRLLNKVKRQFPKALFNLRSLFVHPGDTLAYQSLMIKLKTEETLERFGLIRPQNPDNIPLYMNPLVEKLWHAVNTYHTPVYDGYIYLFKARHRIFFVDEPKYLGWKDHASKGVVVNEVPGDHKNMLLPPNDQQFAKILQSVLNEAAN